MENSKERGERYSKRMTFPPNNLPMSNIKVNILPRPFPPATRIFPPCCCWSWCEETHVWVWTGVWVRRAEQWHGPERLIAGILKRSGWLRLTTGLLSVGCHYCGGKLSHTDPHTLTHVLGPADEWAQWGLGLIKRPAAGSWCKEILWWDYQSTLGWPGPA